ncbi:MAG: hypothetical protein F4Z53_13475 [Acidimicrobiales bacterium]|nr:hypothetical protein [Acidimicrobiales bacterium]MYD35348.1 hypothetical protein [Acidimicrobiales bacterium]MYI08233.1 hypothetical protein [Acidimicrobiales bacterium]
MSSIAEIQDAILVLPAEEFAELRTWMSDLDWERWDGQVQADSASGRLDALADEARAAQQDGTLTSL